MALKRYFKPTAVAVIFLVSGCVFALGATLDREYSTLAAMIASFIALAVVFGVAIPASRRKSLRPNYPRIEHLRIAGKYHVVGTSAKMSGNRYHWSMGISPLHLSG